MSTMITLQHTGRREVSFPGIELAYASDRERRGDRRYRWTTVRVCENHLQDRGYYVGIGHLTTVHKEVDDLMYQWVKTLDEAIMVVRRHAPEFEDEIRVQLAPNRPKVPTGGALVHIPRDPNMERVKREQRVASNKR